MSSPLAIGAVSAVLRNLLNDGLIQAGAAMGSTVSVSAVAPDTIDLEADDSPRLNLFLYQVTPNTGWCNRDLPSRSATTGERLTNAPLALDLHYLLTAYGRADFQAEILLGYAMHLLHERPVLDRAAIRRALDPSPLDVSILPPAFQALTASDLADQVELIRVTPSPIGSDEMSKIWTAIQTHYRPSSAYQASVVLIEGKRPAMSPLPVLSRGVRDVTTHRDRGGVVNLDLLPALPTLFAAVPPSAQPAARLGETVTLTGVRLAGAGHTVLLSHRLLPAPLARSASIDNAGTVATFSLPNDAAAQAAWAAGQFAASLRFTPAGETAARETNAVPLVLAPGPVLVADPALALPGPSVVRGISPASVTVTLHARPQVRPAQTATLALGTSEAVALPRSTAAAALVFEFPATLAADAYPVRLRVDGADSLLLDRSGPAPAFDPTQTLMVPA